MPPSRCSPQRAGAAYHVSPPAVIAEAAAGNVVNHDPVAFFKAPHARTARNNLARGFMAGNLVLIPFRPFAKVLAVNGSDVAAANGGGLHTNKDFSMAWKGHRNIFEDNSAITGKKCSFHGFFHRKLL